MTDDELRALDREVAVKMFGVVPRDVRIKGSTNTVRVLTVSQSAEDGLWDERELRTLFGVPGYSANIGSAWRVVERMRELGWRLSLTDLAGDWTAIFAHNGEKRMRTAAAPSAPVAICRAALEAVKQSEG